MPWFSPEYRFQFPHTVHFHVTHPTKWLLWFSVKRVISTMLLSQATFFTPVHWMDGDVRISLSRRLRCRHRKPSSSSKVSNMSDLSFVSNMSASVAFIFRTEGQGRRAYLRLFVLYIIFFLQLSLRRRMCISSDQSHPLSAELVSALCGNVFAISEIWPASSTRCFPPATTVFVTMFSCTQNLSEHIWHFTSHLSPLPRPCKISTTVTSIPQEVSSTAHVSHFRATVRLRRTSTPPVFFSNWKQCIPSTPSPPMS